MTKDDCISILKEYVDVDLFEDILSAIERISFE